MIVVAIIFINLEFEKFTSNEGKFSILLPETPKYKEERYQSPLGNITLHMYNSYKSEISYGVEYFNVPLSVNISDSKRSLNNMRDGAIKQSSGNLTFQRDILIQRYPGIEYVIKQENFTIISRDYLVNRTAYVIIVVVPNNKASSKNIDKFFNSFTLINNSS
ncbi:hypothetical protein HY637_04495 [Candidatus Woesearchaeota archaeon]|nr:hypothetical protein [Candidatus Woesearchaeota archaeon]